MVCDVKRCTKVRVKTKLIEDLEFSLKFGKLRTIILKRETVVPDKQDSGQGQLLVE